MKSCGGKVVALSMALVMKHGIVRKNSFVFEQKNSNSLYGDKVVTYIERRPFAFAWLLLVSSSPDFGDHILYRSITTTTQQFKIESLIGLFPFFFLCSEIKKFLDKIFQRFSKNLTPEWKSVQISNKMKIQLQTDLAPNKINEHFQL